MIAFASIVLMALNLRSAVTSVGPLLEDLSGDLNLSATAVGLLGALPALAFSAAGLTAVRLLRWFPAERIGVGVLLIEGAGQLIRPWAGGALGFMVVSAITLVGMGVGNIILPALVKAWFHARVGVVTAAYVTALAVGTSVPALIAVPVAAGLGWQRGLALWGLFALLAVPIWIFTARHPRTLPATAQRQAATARPLEVARVAVHHSRIGWGLALLFGMNALNLYAMFTWLPVRLVDAGLTPGRAGTQLALFAAIGILPSLLIPILLARVGRSGLFTLACVACFVAGYAGLLLAPLTATSVWVMLAGLGGGGFPLVLTLFGLRSSSPTTAGALSGFAQAVGYLAAATGPVLVGLLHSWTGGWTAPFGFLGCTLLLMLLGGWLSSPERTL